MKNICLAFILYMILAACNTKPAPISLSNEQKDVVFHNLETRRSIRKYKAEQVNRDTLNLLLKAAIHAPSALNKQPWELRVIQNKTLLDKINKQFIEEAKGKVLQGSAARAQEPGFSVFHHAPTLIAIAGDKNNAYAKVDIGLISQNIMLAAHALGWGTCPIGSVVGLLNNPDNADITGLLNIPEDYEMVLCIALGYPDESPIMKVRYPEKIKIIE